MCERAYRNDANNCRALADEFHDRSAEHFNIFEAATTYEFLAAETALETK